MKHGGMINIIFNVIISKDLIIYDWNTQKGSLMKIPVQTMLKIMTVMMMVRVKLL